MPPTKLLLPITTLLIALLIIAACGSTEPTPTAHPEPVEGSSLDSTSPTPIPRPPTSPGPYSTSRPPLPILPLASPTPVPTPDFDPASYFSLAPTPPAETPWRTDFSKALHRLHRNPSSARSRDGIPSIDNPKFAPVSDDPRLARRPRTRYCAPDRRRRPCLPPPDHDLARDRQRHRRRRARHRHLLPPLQLRHRLRTPHGQHHQLLRRQRPPPLQRPHHVRPGHRQLVAADSRRGYRRQANRHPAPPGPRLNHLLGRLSRELS